MLAAFRAAARELSVRVRQTGGQTTLFLVLFLFLFGALGAAVVDVGLLINARREAQSDADRAALAGTLELSLSANPSVQAADEAAAITKATAWAEKNGVPAGAGLTVSTVRTCFSGAGGDDGQATGIQVTVDRTPPSIFLGALGLTNWNVSATAVSCGFGRDIAVVIDRSGSMCQDSHGMTLYCPDPPPAWDPFSSVQAAALSFAGNFSPTYDQLALVSYSSTASVDEPLGNSFGPGSDFEDAVDAMHPGGYTNIGDAISLARQQLTGSAARSDAAHVLVLLTDGVPNLPDNTTTGQTYAETQAQLAADDGILIYVIGLGNGVDGDFLQGIASIGGGIYLNAPEASDLQGAFQTIADLAQPRLTR